MVDRLKFPFTFDPQRLRADLALIADDEWLPHFNTSYYSGDWSGVSLRSVGGKSTLYPDPTATGGYLDTEVLARLPYIQEVLSTLQCETESVRLLRLGPGARVREHRDYMLGYEDGVTRLHIPIMTGAEVGFYLKGERVEMKEGECWYLNFNEPHSVENNGTTDRVHLVVDCLLNDWLRTFFPTPAALITES
jgi:hypothetical protein